MVHVVHFPHHGYRVVLQKWCSHKVTYPHLTTWNGVPGLRTKKWTRCLFARMLVPGLWLWTRFPSRERETSAGCLGGTNACLRERWQDHVPTAWYNVPNWGLPSGGSPREFVNKFAVTNSGTRTYLMLGWRNGASSGMEFPQTRNQLEINQLDESESSESWDMWLGSAGGI